MKRTINKMNEKLELVIEFVDKMKDRTNDEKLCKEYRDKINDVRYLDSQVDGKYPTTDDIIAFNRKQNKGK